MEISLYAVLLTFQLSCLTCLYILLPEYLGSTPSVGKEQNFAVVKRALEDHASFLMRKLELRELVAFVKATHFDFSVR